MRTLKALIKTVTPLYQSCITTDIISGHKNMIVVHSREKTADVHNSNKSVFTKHFSSQMQCEVM